MILWCPTGLWEDDSDTVTAGRTFLLTWLTGDPTCLPDYVYLITEFGFIK